jgi:hypothetical protein
MILIVDKNIKHIVINYELKCEKENTVIFRKDDNYNKKYTVIK